MSELEVGLQQHLDTFQQFCVEHGFTMNMKKKSHGVQFY
jgi:hypothetical protein